MHLRSGATIASGSHVPSRASTHSSRNVAARNPLGPIIEETSSSEETETMSSMSHPLRGSELEQGDHTKRDLLGNPTKFLVLDRTNLFGGHVYTNEQQEHAVWENAPKDTSVPLLTVEVTDHGDHYMDSRGFRYLKTNRPDEMDGWGNIVAGTKAFSEPLRATKPGISTYTNEVISQVFRAPSAPPLIPSNVQQGLPPLFPDTEVRSRAQGEGQMSPKIPIASIHGKAVVYRKIVYRLYIDQNQMALYEDDDGNLFSTPMSPYGYLPTTVALNIYESQGGRAFEYLDDRGQTYTSVVGEDIMTFTWQGIPIAQLRVRVQSQSSLNLDPPTSPILPKHVNFTAPSSPFGKSTTSMDNLCGSMSHMDLGTNNLSYQRGPVPNNFTAGLNDIHRPPPLQARDSYSHPLNHNVAREHSAPLSRATGPRVSGNGNTYVAPNSYRHEPMNPIARAPRVRRAENKKVRPSQLQKLCKAFDGSGDPYDHVARFRQVLYAEEVEEMHTMVQGFGLTLEGRALRWFQSLSNATLYDFEVLVEAFIKENTKTGIKHNTLTQILDFRQKERETVKDAIARLKSLISRCPPREMPAEDRLISCFLESLRDRNLHTQLFGKRHVSLDDCFDDALLYEDNCNLGGGDAKDLGSDSSSHTSRHINSEAIADLVLKKMRQEQRYPQNRSGYPRAYVCGICAGNHPTGSCQREGNATASGLIWCDDCRKYGTHTTDNCYYRRRAANAPMQPRNDHRDFHPRENPKVGGTANGPVPVLGTQPPLPGAAAVRYVDVATQEWNQHQDIVPVGSYYEDEYDFNDRYSQVAPDESRELMFIGQRPPRGPPMARGRELTAPGPGPCFKCGSTDHWARECPTDRPGVKWPRVERFCADCHIEHLSKNCPNKPQPPAATQVGPPTSSLHMVGVIPSPPTSGSEEVVSLRAVTRAQAREGVALEPESTQEKSQKGRRRRKNKRKRSKTSSSKSLEIPNVNDADKDNDGTSSSDKGGSVAIDKVDDPLQAVKTAMENRVALKKELPKALAEYPCAVEESAQLQFHQKLIEHNQTLLEGPPPRLVHRLPPFHSNLEPIIEVPVTVEQPEPELRESPFGVPDSEEGGSVNVRQNTRIGPNESESIPSLDEELATQLWEEVREKLKGKTADGKPPLTSIAQTDKTDGHLSASSSVRGDWESETVVSSQDTQLNSLPNYLGEYEARSEIVPVPTARSTINEPQQKDAANLQAMMSAPVTCTLPLADLLKLRPHLWENVAGLSKMGEFCKKHHIEPKSIKPAKGQSVSVPINAVAYVPKTEETGNTTLPIEYNKYKAIAILDTGAGISIATKSVWEKWGKLALRKTRVQLQLADGKLAKPLGMLENVTVESCGIKYEHTFAIVDFGTDPNYEVILGRPFMRQLMIIQDWGYNYLYLRHDGVTTRVNLFTHEYRDVAKLPVADFESATTSKKTESSPSYEGEDNFWLFEAETMTQNVYQATLTDEKIQELGDIPPIMELDEEDASQEWMHILATIDTCALPSAISFCDEEGYDVVPIRVVTPVYTLETTQANESDHTTHQSSQESSEHKDFSSYSEEEFSDEDQIVSDEDLERVRALLLHRLDWESETQRRKSERKARRQRTGRSKGVRKPPIFKGKTEFLLHVEAYDVAKSEHSWKQGSGCKTTADLASRIPHKPTRTAKKKVPARQRQKEEQNEASSKRSIRSDKQSKASSKTSKLERKENYKQYKRILRQTWEEHSDSAEEREHQEVPDNFKRYTIQDRTVVLEKPKRTPTGQPGESYDGPEQAKQIDLAEPGEEPRMVWIAIDLTAAEEALLISTLKEYRDVFAWSYKDLKGVDPKVCQHTIPLKDGAKPRKQRPYTYNDTFARKIKEEIDKLLEAEFIYEIEHTEWVSPIVVVPKKNGKLRVCVNLKQVNAVTIRDNYPLPITDHVIERVAGKAAYSFLDGFSGYNQLSIALEDQHKTAFATEWGIYAYRVMPFGLTNAPATFQRLMSHAFKQYLRDFLEIFMDDLCVHSKERTDHIEHLIKVFVQCRVYRICLNPDKCKFMVRQGKILGHIVSKNGISTDMDKIKVIIELPIPRGPRDVQVFMGHCGYYRRFIYMYAEIARPLYGLLVVFVWTEECEESFEKLKKALTSAPILRAPVWDQIFHVHIDASAYAIGCILAQPGEFNKDFPIAYASRQMIAAEKNYTTTEREGLTMVYAVKKFRHYLLANKFIFFVDHQALLYLVNKPCATGRIVRWFVILLEFDFEVAVKKGTMHQRADHLSRITSGEAATGVNDDLPDATLFTIEWVPRWSKDVANFLATTVLPYAAHEDAVEFIKGTSKFSLIAGHLYYRDQDQVLKLVVCPEEYFQILRDAHVLSCGQHLGKDQTVRIVRWQGFWWPTLHEDAATYVRSCVTCRANNPVLHATLYHTMGIPEYAQYIYDYLTKGDIKGGNKAKHRIVILESQKYKVVGRQLYRLSPDGTLRLCVPEARYLEVLSHAHAGAGSGHFGAKATSQMILYSGLWWPTLFMDCQEYVKRCDECQRNRVPNMYDDMPLRPIVSTRAFAKWGIDFVGPLPPAKGTHCQYIIVATDYLTKWAEARASTKNDARTTAKFLYENIFVRFGLPIEIVSDQGTHFINAVIGELLNEFLVTHRRSAPYHPQANGQAESTNKILCTALTKIVDGNKSHWEMKLPSVLWAYRTAYKTAVGSTPFELVYGLNAVLPIEFLVPTLRVAAELHWDGHAMSNRLSELQHLDERRLTAVHAMYVEKRRRKAWHDKNLRLQEFKEGDLVLLYTLKKNKRKLTPRGLGPYVINTITNGGAVRLETLDGESMANFINGSRLRRYNEPLTDELLARLHAAQNEKERKAQMIAEAQAEAKARAQKNRERRRHIQCITTSSHDDDDDPPILINLWANGHSLTALIDSGADANVLSYEAFKKLNCNYDKTSTQLTSFTHLDTTVLGITSLCISQNNFADECQFYIAQPGQSIHELILSRAWMRRNKCYIDWDLNMVHLCRNKMRVTLPLVMTSSTVATIPIGDTIPSANYAESTPMLFVKGTHDHEASTSEPLATETTHTQVLSREAQPVLTVPMPQKKRVSLKSKTRHRWVPKACLQTQGYYQGARTVWIPKAQQPMPNPEKKTQTTHVVSRPYVPFVTSPTYWRPKLPSKPMVTMEPLQKRPPAPKSRMKWVVKTPQPSPCLDTQPSPTVAMTPVTTDVPTSVTPEEPSPYLTIKERARDLQIKLFGLRSLPSHSTLSDKCPGVHTH